MNKLGGTCPIDLDISLSLRQSQAIVHATVNVWGWTDSIEIAFTLAFASFSTWVAGVRLHHLVIVIGKR